jgi:hypothetical protein
MIEKETYPPVIGDWFKNEMGQSFEIVAIDEKEGAVEVQFYDGEIAEYDTETWEMLNIVPISPPEDWSAPFDDMEKDDLSFSDKPFHPEDWSGALDDLEKMDRG